MAYRWLDAFIAIHRIGSPGSPPSLLWFVADRQRTDAVGVRGATGRTRLHRIHLRFCRFGESAGVPAQAEIPTRKIADIIAAANFISTMSFVKPAAIGHLAICASAQYTLAALAAGTSIRSFVSVAGWYHDTVSVAQFYGGKEGVDKRLERAKRAIEKFAGTGEVETVPAYKPGDELAG